MEDRGGHVADESLAGDHRVVDVSAKDVAERTNSPFVAGQKRDEDR